MILKKKPIVVWAGDLHINEMSSLCPPKFRRDEGAKHVFSPAQSKMWEMWADAWKNVYARRRETYIVFGGEFGDVDMKKRSNHLISQNRADVKDAITEALEPALKRPECIIVLRGTEAHSGQEADLDEEIAKDIIGPVYKNAETGESSWWHCRLNIAGKRFDLAHHVSMGNVPWTERNAANRLALVTKMECMDWNIPFPDWVVRGHVHRVADSGMNFAPLRALIAPCWQLPNPYVHRIGAGGRIPEIGLLVIDLETNEPEWIRYEADHPTYQPV